MANILNHKTVYAGFGNKIEWHRFIYDVGQAGVDATTGEQNIMTAGEALIICFAWIKVLTTFTGTSSTLIWGVTGDTNRFLNVTQGAEANLVAGAVLLPPAVEGTPNVLPLHYKMAAADAVIMDIGTATLTAGKCEFVLGVMAP